ncbi:ABC transporter substrate-binding protein [Palleronia pelagia]|uniref:Amino acid/amide ABC transporter substrate-binding protein, HAAT family n=1 Tax=Palleronia pelagia TaxID=387096 RepID=A0A1H8LND0_9RHOB|nr:ABC transporter substrate-binding protein [Palleronia pelagia]SEO06326.1 amino acid/amide ABC transporter substrate-binding protein, HAAT family [Palleronia pelagia]
MTLKTTLAAVALATTAMSPVLAQDEPLRLLVLDDMTGIYSGNGGPNTLRAVEMAVEDFGGEVLGRPIEVISADHQNKPDVGSALAQQFIDEQNVVAMTLGGSSAVGLAAQARAGEEGVITLVSGGYAPNFSGDQCTPYSFHWAPTTRELARGVAGAVVEQGGDSWYLITPDYVFGHALAADATAAVEAAGGSVVGETVHPLNTNDMASALLSAQGSGAKVFGLANAGTDLETTIKQAGNFGLSDHLAAMLVFANNVQALGLEQAQNIRMATSFYWDLNDETRAFGERIMEMNGGEVPTMGHAGAYSAVTHYLNAVREAGTVDADTVTATMKEMPLSDGFYQNASIRENGRVVYDMLLAEVNTPDESTGPADIYEIVATIPGDSLFLSAAESGCPLTADATN